MDKTFLPLASLLLTGCSQAEPPVAMSETRNDLGPPIMEECPAEDYQDLVGLPLSEAAYPDDLNTRVLRPGQQVTMEYAPGRMNLQVDEDEIIQSVRCG